MTDTSNSYSLRSTSASSYTSEEDSSFFINNKQIRFVKKISESKFPVYLVQDTKTGLMQAIKLFPWNEEDNEPSSFYKKEVRFAQISHPNVTAITGYKNEQGIDGDEEVGRVSYILMDYAKNGDLFDAILTTRVPFNEELIRTYFQQIILGLEAIHAHGAAHLDLKLENFLLDENYNVKITDFDLSFMAAEEKEVSTKGTINYRAPEIIDDCCKNAQAADIYSAGIMLFLMKTGGRLPFKERDLYNGINMKELLELNPKMFWKKQCEFLGKEESFFSQDFKRLFSSMVQRCPENRATLEEVKTSEWINKETYSEEELFSYMCGRFDFL